MTRDEADNLLALLVADELDEPTKAALLAYLDTDADLRDKLRDMRVAYHLTQQLAEANSSGGRSSGGRTSGGYTSGGLRLSETHRQSLLDQIHLQSRPLRFALFHPTPRTLRYLAAAAVVLFSVSLLTSMLPTLGVARRTSRQMQASAQLRGIHQGLVVEGQDRGGEYASDLGVLVEKGFVAPEYLISPQDNKQVPADFDKLSSEAKRQWAREQGSYAFIAPGERESLDGNKVVGFEKFSGSKKGVSVVFDDNSVRHMPADEARKLIERQTGLSVEAATAMSERGSTLASVPMDQRAFSESRWAGATALNDQVAYGNTRGPASTNGRGGSSESAKVSDERLARRSKSNDAASAVVDQPVREIQSQLKTDLAPKSAERFARTFDDRGGQAGDAYDDLWRSPSAPATPTPAPTDQIARHRDELSGRLYALQTDSEAETRSLRRNMYFESARVEDTSKLAHGSVTLDVEGTVRGDTRRVEMGRRPDLGPPTVAQDGVGLSLKGGNVSGVAGEMSAPTGGVPDASVAQPLPQVAREEALEQARAQLQQVVSDPTELVHEAQKKLQAGDYWGARDALEQAKDYLPPDDRPARKSGEAMKEMAQAMDDVQTLAPAMPPEQRESLRHGVAVMQKRLELAERITPMVEQAQAMEQMAQQMEATEAPAGPPPEPVLVPGDRVAMSMFDKADLDKERAFQATIDKQGRVAVPGMGYVEAAGMTPTQLQAAVEGRLRESKPADLGDVRDGAVAVIVQGKPGADGRTYEVSDLLTQVPDFTNAPEFDLNEALSNTQSGASNEGGAGKGTSLFGDAPATPDEGTTRGELVEQIVSLIQDTVGTPQEWAALGGDVSSIRELNGNLIVKGTPRQHHEITGLLAQIRGQAAPPMKADSDASQRVALRLREPVPVNFEANKLGHVLDYLRNTSGVSFSVNWPVLEAAGIERDMPITLKLGSIPAEEALGMVLKEASAANEFEPVEFNIVNGVVAITTQREASKNADVRVYDVRDLIVAGMTPERLVQAAQATKRPEPEHVTTATPPPALIPVNPWTLAAQDAQSTFAIDVDTASYGIARRYIRQGFLPPLHTVRMEEFVNAFDYNYPTGCDSGRMFAVHAQAAPAPFAPAGQNVVLLKVGVRGKVIGRDQLKPANLTFVIDTSGSMDRPDRLPLVKRSLRMLLDQLDPADRVSIVTYGTQPSLMLEAAPAGDKQRIVSVIDSLQCGGTTNLGAGVEVGYQIAARHYTSGAVNRVVLCSDGVANVGPQLAEEMLSRVESFRGQGIGMTSVGFGTGTYDDRMLEQLANKGDGRYLYVGSDRDAREAFVEDMAATLPTIARNVKIQVEFDPRSVRRYRLIGYENRDVADVDFRNDAVKGGEVGSGKSATALYELELAPGSERGDMGRVFVRYEDTVTGQVAEVVTPLGRDKIRTRSPQDSPRFYLAACAAEFAELLRESEHAQGGNLPGVSSVLQQVCNVLPLDQRAAELLELVRKAEGLPRATQ